MAIQFRVIERGQPGVEGGGEKKFYATAVSSGETTLEDITALIEEASTVSGADIRAVLYAMVSIADRSLSSGQIVRLGDLGSLRMSISSDAADSADKVTSSTIKGVKTIFTPGPRLKDAMKLMKFEKVS
jgi:predicted histone-like DNA-binding protein